MKKLLGLILIVIFLPVLSWATSYVDTVLVVGDRDCNQWTGSGLGDDWTFIDETEPDDDETYVYTTLGAAHQCWCHDDASMDGDIDSIAVVVRCKYSGGTAGNAKVVWGWRYDDAELGWITCEPYDTVTLTDSYVNYRRVWDENPCISSAWAWAHICYDFGSEQSAIRICSIEIRSGVPTCQIRCTWAIVIVYSSEEDEGVGAKRKNIVSGGIVK